MKIGILTFHSQLNYGGVLQCWALQTVLEKMGHEVVVIDREFEHQIRSVKSVFRGWPLNRWIKFLSKLVLGDFYALRIIRYVRTVLFVRKRLHLTSYTFKTWQDAPMNLGVDLIVVGSDQVWNDVWNNLGVYLLEDAPRIPAIGYAVSLGMTELPLCDLERYKVARSRFYAVSAREKEAVSLLLSVGITAEHVADPVMLVNWADFAVSDTGSIFCYFISPEWTHDGDMALIADYVESRNVKAHLFTNNHQVTYKSTFIVKHYAAAPEDFLRCLASARIILTDSFHGLMFASIFEKKVMVLRTHNGKRKSMFARIEEFADNFIQGECICDTMQQALNAYSVPHIKYRKDKLKIFAQYSTDWLSGKISQQTTHPEGNS